MSCPRPPFVYLDYNATTPVDAEVLEAMLPYFTSEFGNASSTHFAGSRARDAVTQARRDVAQLVGALPQAVLFTAGATEASNLAIGGLCATSNTRRRIVSVVTEHPATLKPLSQLSERGFDVVLIPVDRTGVLDLVALKAAVDDTTLLVSVAAANHEIGSIAPLDQVSLIAESSGALLHVDGAQAAGRLPLDVRSQGIDLLSLSGHKFYGPQGVGALVVSPEARRRLIPLTRGGGQERGLRSGTLNVPGIVGMGAAARLSRNRLQAEINHLGALRRRLFDGLRAQLPGVQLNGPAFTQRVAGNLNVFIPGVEADALVARCHAVALSSGSACAEGTPGPSPVLRAIGLPDQRASESIRMSVGRPTTDIDVDFAVEVIGQAVRELRALNLERSAA